VSELPSRSCDRIVKALQHAGLSGPLVPGVVCVAEIERNRRFAATRYAPSERKRLISDNLLCQIVDDNRSLKVDNRRFSAIFFFDEIFPFLRIEMLGILS
jgi:hypothetical protein